MPSWALRQRERYLLSVLLAVYVGVLLLHAYRSQEELRLATEAGLVTDSRHTAALLADMVAEQRDFVRDLAGSHEVETYLTNKALGMSMRYGLAANLSSMEDSFRNRLARKTVLGGPMYLRLLYYDESGALLVDTAMHQPPLAAPRMSGKGPQVQIDGPHGQILVSTAVIYRGMPSGTLLTVASLSVLSRYLVESSNGVRQLLIDGQGRPLEAAAAALPEAFADSSWPRLPVGPLIPLSSLRSTAAEALRGRYYGVSRTPIKGTPISLITLVPESVIYGDLASRWFFYFAGAAPLILFSAALWVDRARRRASRLEADIVVSNRSRAELENRNEALGLEIRRRQALERELRDSEERYRTYVEHAPEGIFVADSTGRFVDANPSACAMVGYGHEELVGIHVTDLAPSGQAQDHSAMLQAVQQGGAKEVEISLRRKDGSQLVANLRALPLPKDLIMGFCVDISERKRAQAQLQLAASVFAHSLEGIVITDADNRILDVNPSFSRITGYAREEIIGLSPKVLASGRHDKEFYNEIWAAIKERGFWQGEIWNRRKNGEVYPEMLSISTIRNQAGAVQSHIAVFTDISQIKAHEAELDRIAHYDPLTGLPNRRLLADRLRQIIAHTHRTGKPFAVCYLDLDGFKPVNDQYGHEVGDQLLIKLTEALHEVLRAEDTIARLGGDEFVLLFADLGRIEDCCLLLDRVLAVAQRPIALEGVSHRVSASVGVTLCPPDTQDADTLLRHADQAMYLAKEAGKNRYHLYDPEQDRQRDARRLRLERLRQALRQDELVLHYQPKVDLVSRRVIGVEALIRWRHPDEGLLPPSAFLPYLEGTDLEIPVGEWVIESALRQIAAWSAHGTDLVVSVNISPRHLLQPDFARRLQEQLAGHPEVPPSRLELEILESAALSDVARARHALTACRELGVRFALDDFGTGYASLAYFRTLPVDLVKIDQTFVRDMLADPNDLEIVISVVKLGRAFNRPVIAEGVETLEHGSMLILIGCHYGQGYGIGRPMPAEDFQSWEADWSSRRECMEISGTGECQDLSLMVAAQSHLHWVRRVAEALEHPSRSRASDIDPYQCHFCRWYADSGASRYGKLEQFKAIAPCHERVHAIAARLLDLAERGETAKAQGGLADLYAAREELLGHLYGLVGMVSPVPAAGLADGPVCLNEAC
jgi:diguanylate cyclase (GGDEF)-like protein/PAS domain S-box-containing protein